MDLPTVLINQFAKVTNDKKDDLKVETLYGRAKIVDGKQYVQMDGSDLLTPCTSSVTLKNDDRVIVRVGKHEAVVTGNLTDPSVGEGAVTAITDEKLKPVEQSLDAYDQKLKQMNELAANTLGFYYTEEKDENGATISYRHDKPSLADSTIIYKTGIEGFFLSVDGGVTWKAGFDSNGDAVLNILYAIGIQSKWINTRGFTATDNEGNETFRIDEETGAVYIDPKVFMLGDTDIAETITQAVENGKNVIMILTSESQSVLTDEAGNVIDGYDCSTKVTVMNGSKDVTDQCQISVTKVSGLSSYNWDTNTKTLSVESISQENCFAEITAIYNDITVTRRFNVIKYKSGANGKTSYFHIKYSSVANPTSPDQMSEVPSTYIGTYVDFSSEDSTDPNRYTWSRFAGIPGDQGIPGTNGVDGKTSYLHIAYANSADGKTDFSVTDSSDKMYIGQYTDFVQDDSTDPTKYTWTRIRGDQGIQGLQGEKGEQGIPGTNGVDGKTSYFHIKYSSVANPTSPDQISEVASAYIGTYVDFDPIDSTDPSKYTWKRFEGIPGDQGIPGTNGVDGKTSYLHIAYANSADGKTDFSVVYSTNKLYIGQYTDFIRDDSTDPTKYTWTRIKGDQGIQGIQGEKGEQGVPGLDGKGISSITVYYATNNSTTAPTSGWSTTFKAPSESAKYLWTYQVTTFTDGSTETTSPHVIGTYGKSLTAAEIWELLLTQNTDFIYKGSDGNIYIKATYIDTGNLCGWEADRINKTLTASNGTKGKIILNASTGEIYAEDWTSAYSGTREISRDGTTVQGMNIVTVKIDAFTFFTDYITCYGTSTFEGTATFKVPPKLQNLTHVTSGGYVSFLTDGATLAYRASSSKRYKNHVREMTENDIQKLYDLKPVWFTYKDGYLYEEDPKVGKPIPGFYAEVMSEYFPDACIYDSEGRPEDWDPKELVPAMLLMLQEQKKTIDKLEERLSALENK